MGLTKIEWTSSVRKDGTLAPGYTMNLWHGCTKVHEGCDHCYAETLSHRWNNDLWGNDKPRKSILSAFDDLNKYQNAAKKAGEVHRVFVGSMMDIFEKPMPMIDSKGVSLALDTHGKRTVFFNRISEGFYPNLMFLLLTKRPSNINKYIPESWKVSPPENVMFGTSPVNLATIKTLVPQLLAVNGKRFLSIEPQLAYIPPFDMKGIDWVIQGGESGHHKRPFNTDWARSMRDECAKQGVPYFFKQIDKIQAIPDDLHIRQFPDLVAA